LRSVRIGIGAPGADRDAAAVAVLEPDHVVDVRVARQQLGPDPLDGVLHDALHALDGGGDREHVARPDRAVGVPVSLERVALERRLRRRPARRDRQPRELARGPHPQDVLVHPAPRGQVPQRVADRHAVAHDRGAGGEIDQRDLVGLRYGFAQGQPVAEHRAGRQPALVATIATLSSRWSFT
jgi:hypothetical protein